MKKFLILTVVFLLMSSFTYATYYNYWTFDPVEAGGAAYGVDGWVDGGTDKIIFYSGDQAYIYSVAAAGNPNLHPLNPAATGEIAPRTATYISRFTLTQSYGHDAAFYVGSDGFYLGANTGIEKYSFGGSYIGNVAPAAPGDWVQGMAYDPATQTWWTAGGNSREVYKYDMNAPGWTNPFAYTPLPGSSHHDGLEILPNGNLLFADYAGQIVEYTQGGAYVATHDHAPWGHELEGMGSGALGHYWGGSHSGLIFEFGGGSLPAPDPVIPAPGALLLGSMGMGIVGWLRRRRML